MVKDQPSLFASVEGGEACVAHIDPEGHGIVLHMVCHVCGADQKPVAQMPFDIGIAVHAVIDGAVAYNGPGPFLEDFSVVILVEISDMHLPQGGQGILKVIDGVVYDHLSAVGDIAAEPILEGKLLLAVPEGEIP